MNNNNNNNNIVDLVSSDEEKDEVVVGPGIHMHILMEPFSKPSVRYGCGRGQRSKGLFRAYFDKDYPAKRELFRGHVIAHKCTQTNGFVMFPKNIPLKVEIWCFLERPIDHFRNKIRAPDRLKTNLVGKLATVVSMKPDNDNLAKFFLDGMEGIIYSNDYQVVDLRVVKARDNEGTCEGRIAIRVSPCFDVPMPDF